MTRCWIFCDPEAIATRVILPVLLEAIAQRRDMTCRAVFLSGASRGGAVELRWRTQRALRRLQVACGSGRWERSLEIPPLAIGTLVARHGGKACAMPGGDPNHPAVLRQLDPEASGNLGINLYCRRLFGVELLRRFRSVANYHNGSLPRYRGLRATNWSIYAGESRSGFSFHLMDASLDTGNLLCSGSVEVDDGETPAELELRKASAARRVVPEVLEALARDDVGRPQEGIGCTLTRNDLALAARDVAASTLTAEEWRRRLRAFLRVEAIVDGCRLGVTGIEPCGGRERRSFLTADGEWLKVTAVDFWPALWSRGPRVEQ